ncbi:MAG: histidine--tRNA ligase [Pseudomonadota bacterium]
MSQSLSPASGTRDFGFAESESRNAVLRSLEGLAHRYGFRRIETPSFERVEVLEGKYGDEGEKLIFKILKRGDKAHTGEADLALRYDMTVPMLRYYANNHARLPRIFKRLQYGPVWRADRPGKDRYREFFQFDFDTIGSSSTMAMAECIALVGESLSSVGIGGYTINLNSRPLLNAMLDGYGVAEGQREDAIRAVDKMDKVGVDGVREELHGYGVDAASAEALCAAMASHSFADDVRARIGETAPELIADIDAIISAGRAMHPDLSVVFNPLIARGLDYYTGEVFEATHPDVKGSIAGGGRYDGLTGMFLKKPVPACGGSLGIERVLALADAERHRASAAPVFVASWAGVDATPLLAVAGELRQRGIETHLNLGGNKLAAQLKQAEELGCNYMLIQGPEEHAAGQVLLRDLSTREQVAHAPDADALIAAMG